MYKLIALIGESGSGKDSVLREVLKRNLDFHKVINCTTRPKREGEEEGVNYFYLTNEEFAEKIIDMSMLEATSFNNWFYGTTIYALSVDKINIGVFNPYSIDILKDREDIDLRVFYIKTKDKNRLIRQLNREEDPDVEEIIRRFKTDKEDFYDLDFYYFELVNDTTNDFNDVVDFISRLTDRSFWAK